MNVIVTNERQNELYNLDIDIIKSMNGVFSADEIVNTFKNFYFNKMILDVTAVKDYLNISNIQKLSMGLVTSKIIFFLPNVPEVSSSTYLSKLVSFGIYNFTNNIKGVQYLLTHDNTEADVAYVKEMEPVPTPIRADASSGKAVIGVKNLSNHAGATTLVYMLKKELEKTYGDLVYAVEISRHDLEYFNVERCITTNKDSLKSTIEKLEAKIILVDLNDLKDYSNCTDVLYLLEPSTIMLNKLMRVNNKLFKSLEGEKIVLNKCVLSSKDVEQFEYESNTRVFFTLPPIDERRKSDYIANLVQKLGLLGVKKEQKTEKLFGLFKI